MLTQDEVKHVAMLARIGLRNDEIEKYQKILSGVLDFFKDLEKADTDSIAIPRQIIGRENGMRGDIVRETSEQHTQLLLNNAPETKNGYIKVKSVL